MTSNLKCVFCENSVLNQKILLSDEKLKKYQTSLDLRKKKLLKYRDVDLPLANKNRGYHSKCRNAFIAVPIKYHEIGSCDTSTQTIQEKSNETKSNETKSYENLQSNYIIQEASTFRYCDRKVCIRIHS